MRITLESGVVSEFPSLIPDPARGVTEGDSADGLYTLRVYMDETASNRNNLQAEIDILRHLNRSECETAATLIAQGYVSGGALREAGVGSDLTNGDRPFTVLKAYQRGETIYLPDLTMALIEHKKLGVWPGTFNLSTILRNPDNGCIVLTDYRSALRLSNEHRNAPNLDFFGGIDGGRHAWLRKLGDLSFDQLVAPLFDGDSFDLGSTNLFTSAETTLNASKIYHSFRTDDVFTTGERSLDARQSLLDEIEFAPGESVLDVGCNAGLLCHYLAARGCRVTGVDIDPAIVSGARILRNIMNVGDVRFECLDLDLGGPIGWFDTVMLFSVIHHTRHIHRNAARIARSCRRIVVESRLAETGAKPVDGNWVTTTVWRHDDIDGLVKGLEFLFPGFACRRVVGQGDRDRHLVQLERAQ